jgi:hypothetical protein
MVDYGYDDVEKWIEFLIDLKTRMLDFTGNGFNLEMSSEFGSLVLTTEMPLVASLINVTLTYG